MIDIVEVLREVTEGLGWVFHYGRRDFANLVTAGSENDSKNYFFMDPVTRSPIYNEFGSRTGEEKYNGYFMILSKSDLDEVYDGQLNVDPVSGKYKKNIQPKLRALAIDFENRLHCTSEVTVVKMVISDVINLFDENFDGILVNYEFSQTS